LRERRASPVEDEEDDADRPERRTNPAGRRFNRSDTMAMLSRLCQQARCHMTSSAQNSEAHQTTTHDVIWKWADARAGKPATVRVTEEDGPAGILRIDFDPPDEGLDRISWDEFFDKFGGADIAFLRQDRAKDGKLSCFHKLVRR
jgi:hypothetical protein